MKVVFLGSARSGKTSIIQRMMYETFQYRYKPTVEDHFQLDTTLPDGESLVLNMVDTSGTDEFPVMRDLRIRQAEVFVVVYALDNRESFQYATRMCHKIKDIKENHRTPIILVGNKTDLSSQRSLTYEDGYQFMKSLDSCFFVETSAQLGDHIDYLLTLFAVQADSKYEIYRKNQFLVHSRVNYVPDRSIGQPKYDAYNTYNILVKRKKHKRRRCSVM